MLSRIKGWSDYRFGRLGLIAKKNPNTHCNQSVSVEIHLDKNQSVSVEIHSNKFYKYNSTCLP